MRVTGIFFVLFGLIVASQAAITLIAVPARELEVPHVRVVRSAQFGFGGFPGFGGGGGGFSSSNAAANAQSFNFGGGNPFGGGFSGSSAQASASSGNFNFGGK